MIKNKFFNKIYSLIFGFLFIFGLFLLVPNMTNEGRGATCPSENISSLSVVMFNKYSEQYGSCHFEEVTEDCFEISFVQQSIIIDAKLDDWKGGNPTIGLTDPWGLNSKDETQFDYKIIYGSFYFYFKSKDSSITISPFTNELSVAEGDRVELFFSKNKDLSKYYCLEIGPMGDVLDYQAKYYRKFNEEWNFNSLEIASSVLDYGYIIEGKIRLEELEELNLKEDIYLGVFRADFHDKDKVNWYTKVIPDSETPDFHIPSAFEGISIDK